MLLRYCWKQNPTDRVPERDDCQCTEWVYCLFVLSSNYAVPYKLGFNSEFVYFVNLFNKLVLTSRDSAITNNAKSDSDAS